MVRFSASESTAGTTARQKSAMRGYSKPGGITPTTV